MNNDDNNNDNDNDNDDDKEKQINDIITNVKQFIDDSKR